MPTINFAHPDGTVTEMSANAGQSVMRAALENSLPGIVGECGGQTMCATCHVFVAPEQPGVNLPDVSEEEDEMLECTATERTETSRLSCQLIAGEHFESLTVTLPENQV